MPKFDFNNSTYAKLWNSRDGRAALQIFVNDPDIIKRLPSFWKAQFGVDPTIIQRNPDGTAVFSAAMRGQSMENMLDWRAPLGDARVRDKKGVEHYEGSIPDFIAPAYVEQAMEREAREQMFQDYFGNDAQILAAYADVIGDMIREGDSTMSNLAAQALSKGFVVYNYGQGITGPIYKAPIPEENKVKAGAVAWSDPSCKLLDQMEKIEQDFRDRTAFSGAMKWQLTRDTFSNVFLKNAQVIEYINNWRTINDKVVVNGWSINAEMFNEAFADNEKISTIEVVEEKQYDGGKAVSGWEPGVAVLRPVGFAGRVKRASILDKKMAEKYGSSVIDRVFSTVDIYTIMNTTLNNGNYKEWHTDLFVSAVPALEEFMHHIIVKTDEADS